MVRFCLVEELQQGESGTIGGTLSRSDDQVFSSSVEYLNIHRLQILACEENNDSILLH